MYRSDEVKPRSAFSSKYEKVYTLGKGNFGKVYLVRDRITQEQFAVKVVDKKVFKTGDQKQHSQREQMICESFASGLNHKNIVQVYDVLAENDFIYIVMEYIEGGELFDKIKQSKGLSEPTARRWFREIIEAVDYIHKNSIIHRDLKPENVLIDRSQRIKICDFGFGNTIKETHQVLSTYCGSPFYAAPEMVTATPYLGPPVDLWSCGVILYAMLTGSLPFQSDEMPQLFQKISRAQYVIPDKVSRDASDLIQKLLCKNPKDRISAKDCLLHPWLAPPTMARYSILTSSQLTLTSSKYTNTSRFSFQQRKKVGTNTIISKETSLSSIIPENTKNEVLIEIKEENPKETHQCKKPSFIVRLFRKKSQIAPTAISDSNIKKLVLENLNSNSTSQSNQSKKKIKSKLILDRFTGLFKTPVHKRITDK